MTLSYYLIIQQIVMGVIISLGGQLIFERVPKELKGSRIHLSSQVMGLAISIIPLASFIYYFLNLRSCGPEYATAINLSAYCVTTTLVTLSYYILLNRIDNKKIVRTHIFIGILYPVPMWAALLWGSEFIASHILIASYTLFAVLAVIHTFTCIYFYRQNKRLAEHNNKKGKEIKLIRRVIHISLLLIIVSLCAPSFFAYPMWLGMVYIALFALGFIYIYYCYRRLLALNINNLITSNSVTTTIKATEPIIEEIEETEELEELEDELFEDTSVGETQLSDEIKQSIEKHLQVWLKKREYTNRNLTINTAAKAIYTNRTYLSKYINTVYQCSFRTWVTQLRINEAKELLIDSPELSVAAIAIQVGFASTESFSHIFTRLEHTPPSRWREEQSLKQQHL